MGSSRISTNQFLWLCIAFVIIGTARFCWLPWIQQANTARRQAAELTWMANGRGAMNSNSISTGAIQQQNTDNASADWVYYQSSSESGAIAAMLQNLQYYAGQSGVAMQSASPRRIESDCQNCISVSASYHGKQVDVWRLLYLLSSSVPLHTVHDVRIRPLEADNVSLEMVVDSIWRSGKAGLNQQRSSHESPVTWSTLQHSLLFHTATQVEASSKDPALLQLRLTGIVYGSLHSTATIVDAMGGTYTVQVGDTILGATVTVIEQTRVVLLKSLQEYTLTLSE